MSSADGHIRGSTREGLVHGLWLLLEAMHGRRRGGGVGVHGGSDIERYLCSHMLLRIDHTLIVQHVYDLEDRGQEIVVSRDLFHSVCMIT